MKCLHPSISLFLCHSSAFRLSLKSPVEINRKAQLSINACDQVAHRLSRFSIARRRAKPAMRYPLLFSRGSCSSSSSNGNSSNNNSIINSICGSRINNSSNSSSIAVSSNNGSSNKGSSKIVVNSKNGYSKIVVSSNNGSSSNIFASSNNGSRNICCNSSNGRGISSTREYFKLHSCNRNTERIELTLSEGS
ncbi:hypothetical protein FHG87_020289 [Trinorchestia longiramus]|nr:hypothetical protein FHG87_020289 [Trinorchestia longiramus]